MPALPRNIHLTLCSTAKAVPAQIVELTPEMVATRMGDAWWKSTRIKIPEGYRPVDIDWDWAAFAEVIRDFPDDAHAKMVAVVTPDQEIQGALLVSTEKVPSDLRFSGEALVIQGICTAPHNRDNLALGGLGLYSGVGVNLLLWAVSLSMELSCQGRLRLDASPEEFQWYERRGFQDLQLGKRDLGGIDYLPMELPVEAAAMLLAKQLHHEE